MKLVSEFAGSYARSLFPHSGRPTPVSCQLHAVADIATGACTRRRECVRLGVPESHSRRPAHSGQELWCVLCTLRFVDASIVNEGVSSGFERVGTVATIQGQGGPHPRAAWKRFTFFPHRTHENAPFNRYEGLGVCV